jgi:hypothetical protein
MVLSLAVLLVPIVLLLVFYRVVLGGDTPVTVDPGPALAEARSAALFPVAAPGDLGRDWHVSSATFRRAAEGATLRLGYLNPDGHPIQLIESSVPPGTLLPAELTKDAAPTGQFRTADRLWRRYDARPGESALVNIEAGRTMSVVGKTEQAGLEALATAL